MVILQKAISFFSFISLNIIGLIFFLVFYLNRTADKTFFAANLVLLTFLLIMLITFFASNNKAINFFKVLPLIPEHYKAKAQSFLASLRLTFFNLLKDTRLFIFLIIQAYVIWLLYAVKAYIVAQSLGIDISFAQITVVTLFSYMIAMIPLFPGGLGSFEAAYAFMFTSMGFDVELGITSALILRFVTFWFVFFISTLYLGLYKLTGNIRKIKILSRQFKEQNEIGYENEL